MTPLATVAEVVAALGGTAAVARRYEIGMSAVSNWKAAKRLPPRLHHRIFKDCQAAGIRLDDSLFAEPANGGATVRSPPNGARRRSLGADIKAATKAQRTRRRK